MARIAYLVSLRLRDGKYARLPLNEADKLVASNKASFVPNKEWRANSTAAQRALNGEKFNRLSRKSGPKRSPN
jgi:hypothetical protein